MAHVDGSEARGCLSSRNEDKYTPTEWTIYGYTPTEIDYDFQCIFNTYV